MAEHDMKLDDKKHRSIKLGSEISSDPKYSVKVILKKTASGNMVEHLIIRSIEEATTDAKVLEISVNGGAKIPPEVEA